MTKIAVIGAGIIGLSSALRIQKEFPSAEITIIAEKFSPETTSDGAAGIWGPYLLGNTPDDDIFRWAEETHHFFRGLWNQEDGGTLGISMITCMRVSSCEDYPVPKWKDIVYGFRSLTAKELQRLGKPSLRKGFEFTTFICEPRKLLPHFLKKFIEAGGNVLNKRVENLEELRKDYEIVVNCTGIQAHYLVPDKTVQPKRGQIIRVEAPSIKWAILDDDEDGRYIIPNQDSVVLGGTHQEGDWSCNPYPEDTIFIKNGCFKIIPSLKDCVPSTPNIWVGLRPGRPSVRLQMEVLRYSGEKPFFLCSNYGQGGSGITLFWGCAKDVVELIKEATLQTNSKL